MSHHAQRVATKLLPEGNYAECYRCCGDPATDSWITVVGPERLPAAALQQAIAKHAAGVEARHSRMAAALPVVRACACTLDAAAMAAAMEREHGKLKAGVTLPALGSHAVRVGHAVPWNDEQVRIECDCCTGGANPEAGASGVGRAGASGVGGGGVGGAGASGVGGAGASGVGGGVVTVYGKSDAEVEEQARRVMERAAMKHSGQEWEKRNAQKNP